MNKIVPVDQVVEQFHDGMTLMIGGFLGVGTPELFIDKLIDNKIKDITIIANDTSFIDKGIGRLIQNKQVKKVIVSHIGTNAETGRQMNAGEMEVVLVPQGTLAEQVRCGGTGLGGVLTLTGIGTPVEEGKQKITVDGKEYLLETALRAEMALIVGHIVDRKGNIYYDKSTRNFNPLMAMAADKVAVLADKIVEVGELDPGHVITPGIFVDYIVEGK